MPDGRVITRRAWLIETYGLHSYCYSLIKKAYYWIQNKMARTAFEFNLEQAGYPIQGRTQEAMNDMNYYYLKLRSLK
jgi:hypothetical protein